MAHLIEVTSVVPASLQRVGEFAGNLRPHGTMWTQLGLNVLLKRIAPTANAPLRPAQVRALAPPYNPDSLALTSGTRLGVYEVTAQIGEGGMGQVYRARDTKLDRDVAIKILPEAFAHDADPLPEVGYRRRE